jgi:hypothetical protein
MFTTHRTKQARWSFQRWAQLLLFATLASWEKIQREQRCLLHLYHADVWFVWCCTLWLFPAHTALGFISYLESCLCDSKLAYLFSSLSRSGCKVKKYEAQSLALDTCSQVSLYLSPKCVLDQCCSPWEWFTKILQHMSEYSAWRKPIFRSLKS